MLPRIEDDLRVERFADALLARLEAAAPTPRAVRPAAGGRRLKTIAGVAVVVVALTVTVTLGGLSLGGAGAPIGPGPEAATAAEVLLSSATAAAHQSPLAPGQYLRVRTLRWSAGGDGHLHRVLFTSWMAADGAARFLIEPRTGSAVEPSAERCTPKRCLLRAGSGPAQPMPPARYGPGRGFTAAQLQRLPTDPDRLLAVILARARSGTGLSRDPWEMGFPLLVAPLPPRVRAALYRGLAQLPGVRRVGVERVGGRVGVALARRVHVAAARVERVIVVDPKSGALLAARATVDGHLSDRRVYSAAVVDSAGPA